ncbi:MAG TPA: ComEC/Rec2 family competence protein [Chthonomonadaceae bacterium]|nr:ComEC/Rec2 family competence protein [Chthonomonadaceae bacterium]
MTDRPLVALALAFAAGIGLAALALPMVILLLLGFLVLAVLTAWTQRPVWSAAAVLVAFALLGSARYCVAALRAPDDVSRLAPSTLTLTGVVCSDVERPQGRRAVQLTLAAREARRGTAANAQAQIIPVSGCVTARLPVAANSELPRYGDLLIVTGWLAVPGGPRNPGGFDYRSFLARGGVYATLNARRPEDWRRLRGQEATGNPFLRQAFALRQTVMRHAQSALPSVQAGVLNGILLGARGDMPHALDDVFERTGTVHILATAGLHVGMVVGLLLGALRLLRVAQKPALVLALLLLALYATMAGGRPSVVRAVIMAGVYLLGMLLEREPSLPNALALAALILLLINPNNLFDVGFQLSFATVISIVLLMPLAEETLEGVRKSVRGDGVGARWLRRGVETLAVCFFLAVTAQIGAMPLVAYYSNEVSLVSILANTLAVPVITLVIGLGFSAAALGAFVPLLAWPLDRALEGLLAYVVWIVQGCAALPYATINVPSPPAALVVGYYAALWSVAWRWQNSARGSGRKSR